MSENIINEIKEGAYCAPEAGSFQITQLMILTATVKILLISRNLPE